MTCITRGAAVNSGYSSTACSESSSTGDTAILLHVNKSVLLWQHEFRCTGSTGSMEPDAGVRWEDDSDQMLGCEMDRHPVSRHKHAINSQANLFAQHELINYPCASCLQ
jgi:hypothetical protein